MGKGVRLTGCCLTAVAVVWLAAFFCGKWNAAELNTESVVQSLHQGLKELNDREAAEEYLVESIPKLRKIMEKLKTEVISILTNWGEWRLCSLPDKLYPVLRTVFVVSCRK